MKTRKLFIVCVLAMAMTFMTGIFNLPVLAASGPNVTDHTQAQIKAYIEASGADVSNQHTYSVQPVKPTTRGELTDSSQQSALAMLNNIRYIAGLAPVTLNANQKILAQAAAFADYVLDTLTHTPDTKYIDANTSVPVPKPDGMSDEDWQLGNQGGRSTNIAWNQRTLNAAVYAWTFDNSGSNLQTVGHRRWVLNPKMGTTGFGAAGAYYAMYSHDNSGSGTQTNVAWPAKNMPVEYFNTSLPWTISTGRSVTASNVRVKLTRVNDGKTWNFSGAESYSTSSTKYFNVNDEGYGQTGCIIFRPDGIGAYTDGDEFNVEITGAGDTISYTVKFFSLNPMTGIKFSTDPISVPITGTRTASIKPVPDDCTDNIDSSLVRYSIADTSIATVDANGKITPVKLGQTKITATYKGYTATADVYVAKSIADQSVTLVSRTNPEYTGSHVLPIYVIQDGDKTLVEGVDYYLKADEEIVNANDTAYVSVYGMGNYYGSMYYMYSYRIIAKAITEDMVSVPDNSIVYDGKSHSPDPVLTYNGMTLVEGTDYTITRGTGTKVGSYSHRITGKGNYRSSYTAGFEITPRVLDESMFTVDDGDLVYDGEIKKPVITGKAGDLDLREGTDYTASVDEAVNAGEYRISIKGINNCTGDVELMFKVQKAQRPPQPDTEYEVPYEVKHVSNGLITGAEGWEFAREDFDRILEVGKNVCKLEYKADDADNYEETYVYVTVERLECEHEKTEVRGAFDPDCENDGYTGDTFCLICEKQIEEGKVLEALGHDPVVTDAVEPGCETEGNSAYYTCRRCEKFFSDEECTDEIEEGSWILEPIRHDWEEPTYQWAEDLSTATASRVCKHDATHVQSEKVKTTRETIEEPTCTETGLDRYTALFGNKVFDAQTKDVETDALGHDWGKPEYKWAEDNKSVTATRVCDRDESHQETETVAATGEITKDPTCEEKGETTYTSEKFDNEAFEVQTNTVADVDAIGHAWGNPTYEWAADNSSVTAKRVCGHDVSHEETETVQTTSDVSKPATCEEAGEGTFTAEFVNDAFEKQSMTAEIAPLGHDWGAWESVDDSQHKRVCKHDDAHSELADHTWDEGKVTKEPTVDEEGVRTYTCTDCGATRTEAVPKLEPAPTPAPAPGSDPNQKGSDGTAVGPGASAAAAHAAIIGMPNDNDPAGALFGLLKAKSTKQTKTSVTVSWTKVAGASKYVIYGNACGKKNKMQKIAEATGKSKTFKSVAGKKVKKGTYYKFIIVALDKNNNVVSTSKIIHAATKGGKVGNDKSVKVSSSVIKKAKSLKKGKTLKLKAKAVKAKLKVKRHRAVSYESSNPKIATVSKKGVVKGKSKGSCYVYAYAQNGVSKKIKVVVK